MTVIITLKGKQFERNYDPRFCQLPGCGVRIPFRMSKTGVPESCSKYNKRKGCCDSHSRKIQKLARIPPPPGRAEMAINNFLFGRLAR